MSKFWVIFGYVVAVAVALGPIASVILATMIANYYGCQLNEGSSIPCRVGDRDIGPLLYRMFVSGWYIFFSIPAGVLLAVVWAAIVHFTK